VTFSQTAYRVTLSQTGDTYEILSVDILVVMFYNKLRHLEEMKDVEGDQ